MTSFMSSRAFCGLVFVASWRIRWITSEAARLESHRLRQEHDAILVGAGLWQLSGVKDRCLAHCRSPFGLLLHYGSYKGRFRDVHPLMWVVSASFTLYFLVPLLQDHLSWV